MSKVRIAHIADFHLGGELYEKNELNEQINKSLIKSLANIFNILNLSKVDIVLIAGDFYESSSIDLNLLKNIKEIFSKFNGKIVISPGNHDYVSLESSYNSKWPQNTFIFKNEKIEFFEFSDLKTRVYGFAFNSSYINKRMLQDFPILDEKYINLGVFHGQIDSSINNYNPIFLEDIENSNLDYIALGHIHKRSDIAKIGNTYYAYSGNPVGRGFDETGEKGIYLGDIGKTRNGLNFYKIDNREFYKIDIEIKNFETQDIIEKQIREYLLKNIGKMYKQNYYKINLEGFISKNQTINIPILEANLSDINYVEIYDKTKLKLDFENIKNEHSLRGNFVRKVLELESDLEQKQILDFGIRAFEDLL